MNRLGDRCESGVNRLGDTSAFVIPVGQLLLTRQGKTRIIIIIYGPEWQFLTWLATSSSVEESRDRL